MRAESRGAGETEKLECSMWALNCATRRALGRSLWAISPDFSSPRPRLLTTITQSDSNYNRETFDKVVVAVLPPPILTPSPSTASANSSLEPFCRLPLCKHRAPCSPSLPLGRTPPRLRRLDSNRHASRIDWKTLRKVLGLLMSSDSKTRSECLRM